MFLCATLLGSGVQPYYVLVCNQVTWDVTGASELSHISVYCILHYWGDARTKVVGC